MYLSDVSQIKVTERIQIRLGTNCIVVCKTPEEFAELSSIMFELVDDIVAMPSPFMLSKPGLKRYLHSIYTSPYAHWDKSMRGYNLLSGDLIEVRDPFTLVIKVNEKGVKVVSFSSLLKDDLQISIADIKYEIGL